MHTLGSVGFFGKLLSRGDFVGRGLPPQLLSKWDVWLQQSIACSQQQLGSQWLSFYLKSPIWHFFARPGCIDAMGWTGLLMPSVDRVGRHYPLLISAPLRGKLVAFEICGQGWQEWHLAVELLARQSLQGAFSPELLADKLNQPPLPSLNLDRAEGLLPQSLRFPKSASINSDILGAADSLWWTQGSPYV